MISILSCFAAGRVLSLSDKWVHRRPLSACIYWARMESALVLRALQRVMTVSRAGKSEPHSMRLMVLAVQPHSSASSSWVSLRCLRMRWIFRPPALKSNVHHPCLNSLYIHIMPIFAHLIHFLIDIYIRIMYTCGNYIRRWIRGRHRIKKLLLFGASKAPGRAEGGGHSKNRGGGVAALIGLKIELLDADLAWCGAITIMKTIRITVILLFVAEKFCLHVCAHGKNAFCSKTFQNQKIAPGSILVHSLNWLGFSKYLYL